MVTKNKWTKQKTGFVHLGKNGLTRRSIRVRRNLIPSIVNLKTMDKRRLWEVNVHLSDSKGWIMQFKTKAEADRYARQTSTQY